MQSIAACLELIAIGLSQPPRMVLKRTDNGFVLAGSSDEVAMIQALYCLSGAAFEEYKITGHKEGATALTSAGCFFGSLDIVLDERDSLSSSSFVDALQSSTLTSFKCARPDDWEVRRMMKEAFNIDSDMSVTKFLDKWAC